jgi:hypothetical protein
VPAATAKLSHKRSWWPTAQDTGFQKPGKDIQMVTFRPNPPFDAAIPGKLRDLGNLVIRGPVRHCASLHEPKQPKTQKTQTLNTSPKPLKTRKIKRNPM